MSTRPRDDQQLRYQQVTFADILRALRRGAPFALLVTGIALAVSVLMTQRAEPVYQANASVLVSRPTSSTPGIDMVIPPAVDARVYQRALRESTIVHDALLRLDGHDRNVAEMNRFMEKVNVSVESHDISSVIGIAVRDPDPERAASQANAIAAQLIEWDRDRGRAMLEDAIVAIERAIVQIDAQIAAAVRAEDQVNAQRLQTMSATQRENLTRELDVARSRSASAVVVGVLESLSTAQAPVEPISPRPVFNAFVAVLLGLLFGYGLQLARWSLDTRVGDGQTLAEASGLPVLGELTVPRRSLRLGQESTATLRASLMGTLRSGGTAVLGVTSVSDFSEKNGVATSLADSLARSGYRTLVVDSDLRRAGSGYGVDVGRYAVPRLEEYLRNPELQLEPLSFSIGENRSFDAILPGGMTEILAGPLESGFSALAERLRGQYDVVIFDVPPLTGNPDAGAALAACEFAVICVGNGSKRSTVQTASSLLSRTGVQVLGAFLTETRRDAAGSRKGGKVDALPVTGGAEGAVAKGEPSPRAYARVRPR